MQGPSLKFLINLVKFVVDHAFLTLRYGTMNTQNLLASLSNPFERMSFYISQIMNEQVAMVMLYAVILLALHALYFAALIIPFKKFIRYSSTRKFWMAGFIPYAIIIVLVIFSHVADIFIFAYILDNMHVFPDPLTAFYFVGEMYTTVGFGSYTLEPQWRSLPLILAFSGLFSFSISASVLFNVLGYLVADRHQKPKVTPQPQA